ncbi:glycosyltransferase family 2 protein [Actinoplanes sp. L3-i22]|uniref:glycosyltransferase family 2 protein n=1 Tax=Actinoplanes sp. L3-i22 TaxID=2836373 RepID=UPI001C77236F|nr:glycosyltransferase family 2 protein [Actinoplanes sp. L3-i22]BCY11050.1 hypothetical protein L3i22_061380 [Actinoplanes sp. L3-i22]
MAVTVAQTLLQRLAGRDNDYDPIIASLSRNLRAGWHDPSPRSDARGTSVSVVIAARNSAYCLPSVLDALARQETDGKYEVIVVDDASTDSTGQIAAAHPVTSIVWRLPQQVGSGPARNVGTMLAEAPTVVYLDADMALPRHVLATLAGRAHDDLVLVGFRQNVPFQEGPKGVAVVPAGEPDLTADHRVVWRPPTGVPMFYTGMVFDKPVNGKPLDDTDEFRALGHGQRYYDWDLPRMVVTALVAVPRARVVACGGFDPGFSEGWGCEDTYLGARLIAAGCKVAPVRSVRGFHLDPPQAEQVWQQKFATAARNVERYWRLLDTPDNTAPLTKQPSALKLITEGIQLK